MSILLTAGQFRLLWRRAGGDTIHLPIQAPSRGRMVSDRDRIGLELEAWWAATADADPDLYAAVRGLRQSPSWLHLAGFPLGGKPIRALLGAGGGEGGAVLAVQDAVQAVRAGDDPDWYADTAIDPGGWSLERGGDIRLSVGHTAALVGHMLSAVPQFQEGASPALRAESAGNPDAGYTSQATTTSRAERIAALLGRPRTQHGFLSASVVDGAGLRETGRLSWLEVAGDGGYLVAEHGPISLKPAAHRDLATAARQLLGSAETAPSVV